MQFLTKDGCAEFMTRAGLDSDAVFHLRHLRDKKHATELFYKSRLADALTPGKEIETWLPKFTSALFWISGSPWGDGWGEDHDGMRNRIEWKKLKKLRESHGESQRLYNTPGHLLEPGDRGLIPQLVEIALLAGWDCALMARPNTAVVYCSHDDSLVIQSDRNVTGISETLRKLGFNSEGHA